MIDSKSLRVHMEMDYPLKFNSVYNWWGAQIQ